MPQRQGIGRSQMLFFCTDQQIAADNPVRVIDAFVDALDLDALGFVVKGRQKTGSPAYSAAMLLKLYCYGYFNRIRSSRQFELACQRNLELWWLLEQQKPCYRTISSFRKDNKKALKKTFQALVQMCRSWGLYGAEIVAIDGSKFRAQNSKKNNYNQKKIDRHLEYIDKKTEEYLTALDRLDAVEEAEAKLLESIDNEADTSEQSTESAELLQSLLVEKREELQNKLIQKEESREKYENLQSQLNEAFEKDQTRQISTTDPDARALPLKMNIVEVAYNLQTAVDAKHNLIVHYDVTNERDDYALADTAIAARDALEVAILKALADKGYNVGLELKRCAEAGILTYVAIRENAASLKKGNYAKKHFVYSKETDSYTCPANQTLTSNGKWYERKSSGTRSHTYKMKVYKTSFHTCKNCPFAEQCAGANNLKKSKGREIQRTEYDDYIEANRQRITANKELYRRRQAIVEHPYGTIKRGWGYTYTLLRGKENVGGEFGLIATAYNLRRAMSILGVKDLIERLKSLKRGILLTFSAIFLFRSLTQPLNRIFFRRIVVRYV